MRASQDTIGKDATRSAQKTHRVLFIHKATEREAIHIARSLCAADRREVRTSTGMAEEDAVLASFRVSRQCFSARLGTPLASPFLLFGVADEPDTPGLGSIWLLATHAVSRAWLPVMRETPVYLSLLASQYPLGVHNYIDVRNTAHLRWCLKVGFSVVGNVVINSHDFIQVHYPCALPQH